MTQSRITRQDVIGLTLLLAYIATIIACASAMAYTFMKAFNVEQIDSNVLSIIGMLTVMVGFYQISFYLCRRFLGPVVSKYAFHNQGKDEFLRGVRLEG